MGSEERRLDIEIAQWNRRKDVIVKAIRYHDNNEDSKMERLIQKWHSACQQASNYMLNAMQLKIMSLGGYDEWRREQKRRESTSNQNEELAEQLADFTNSEEFSNMSIYEQSSIMEQLNGITNEESETSSDDNPEEGQLSMEEMYSLLRLDYNLVFGENY